MQHKWYNEIVAWANGAEIETRQMFEGEWLEWEINSSPDWFTYEGREYRIKPQPKEPQYLYIYGKGMGIELTLGQLEDRTLIGKIKLEVDDVPSNV